MSVILPFQSLPVSNLCRWLRVSPAQGQKAGYHLANRCWLALTPCHLMGGCAWLLGCADYIWRVDVGCHRSRDEHGRRAVPA